LRSISIVVPAYNEEKRLPSTLEALRAFVASHSFEFVEIVVVDDGSCDGTAELVRRYAGEHPQFRLVQNPGNRGKGYAVRNGMMSAIGEWILYSDADLSAPIDQLERLWAAVQKQPAQVAIGSRAVDRTMVGVRQPLGRELAGRFFNLVMRLLTGLPFRDTQCGFKLFHRDAARVIFPRQQLDGFGFDVEDLYIAKVLGIKAIEVPVRWDNVEGTKVSLLRGADSFLDLLRVRKFHLAGRYRREGRVP
jgi:glycosyltransferase involved in cell wall biosynthesis